MTRSTHFLIASLCVCLTTAALTAQQSNAGEASIPHLIPFSGVLRDVHETPIQGTVAVTFAFYKDEQGGAPLWMETQNVTPDSAGHYSVMLGATKNDGVPAELFISKEARWLGVESQGLLAPARILLLSVPYALKAADAETIGGLPPSAFVLAGPASSASASNAESTQSSPPTSSSVTTSGGTPNVLALFQSATDIENSAVSQSGSGATAKIGINNTAPASTLDVKGKVTVRGTLSLPASGVATATAGANSQPANLSASSFNSGNSTAVAQTFQFKAEPAGNNTATPSGTLNLLFGAGATAPAETGLKIASNGQITFAAGQTFPGSGGTGGITGVTAGTDLTGGGTSGNVTLNVDTTQVPQLNTANTFTGNQAVIGNVTSNGLVSGLTVNALSSFNISGNPFAFGSQNTGNSYFGFAGNQTGAGDDNVGTGQIALLNNGAGSGNTADGVAALKLNSGGSNNSAVGSFALSSNTTGSNNTALGANAGPDSGHPTLNNATAIGANAQVTASNAMVLGSINGVNGATADTLVGIGTTAPAAKLDVHGNANFTGPITFASGQTFPGAGTITGVTAGTGLSGGGTSGTVPLSLNTSFSDGRYAQLGAKNTFTGVQVINNNVGIGISSPAVALHANGTIRSETGGFSAGGTAPVLVDAPFITGGRLAILANGNVGINNPNPQTNLDVSGTISAFVVDAAADVNATRSVNTGSLNVVGGGDVSTGITTDHGITAAGNVSVGGSVIIRNDIPMSAAPHMYANGFIPGPIPAGALIIPIAMIVSKAILITRMVLLGTNTCSSGGPLTFTIFTGTGYPNQAVFSMNVPDTAPPISDSQPLSIPVAAGSALSVSLNATPTCPFGTQAPTNIAVGMEYVMQ